MESNAGASLSPEQIAEILAFAPPAEATTEVLFERRKPAPVKTAAEVQWAYEADLAALENHRCGGRRRRTA